MTSFDAFEVHIHHVSETPLHGLRTGAEPCSHAPIFLRLEPDPWHVKQIDMRSCPTLGL